MRGHKGFSERSLGVPHEVTKGSAGRGRLGFPERSLKGSARGH